MRLKLEGVVPLERETRNGALVSRLTARSSRQSSLRGLFRINTLPPAFIYLMCQLICHFDRPQFLSSFDFNSNQNTRQFITQCTSGIPFTVELSTLVKCAFLTCLRSCNHNKLSLFFAIKLLSQELQFFNIFYN